MIKSNLHYSNIETKIISNLKNAKKNIKIAVAWFTNPNLFNLLESLIDNNVEVELILSDEKLNFTNEKIDFQRLIDKNVTVKVNNFPKLMHNKFCVIDNRILITGSYNWTLKAEKCNYENVIISTDEKLVDDFINYFDYLTTELETVSNISKIKTNEYIDKKEIEIELELIRNQKSQKIEIEKSTSKIYTDDLNKVIDKAYLLYLNAELKEAIDFVYSEIEKYEDIPEFYDVLSSCYWRLNDCENQIKYAEKVLEIENDTELADEANNLLGIGYSLKKGGEQKSIFYYKKCIDKNPNNFLYYRNRAMSYINLEELPNLPLKIKNDYKYKADEDLKKILEIAKNTENKGYQLLYSEALANSYLGNQKIALNIINKSIEAFNAETDKFKKDKNTLKDIKNYQKAISKLVK